MIYRWTVLQGQDWVFERASANAPGVQYQAWRENINHDIQTFLDLARQGGETTFKELAQMRGVPQEELEAFWTGTVKRAEHEKKTGRLDFSAQWEWPLPVGVITVEEVRRRWSDPEPLSPRDQDGAIVYDLSDDAQA